jgi:hypothetical protein
MENNTKINQLPEKGTVHESMFTATNAQSVLDRAPVDWEEDIQCTGWKIKKSCSLWN